MRAVVQRVDASRVIVDEKVVGEIGHGLNVLLGVEDGDEEKDLDYIADKVVNLRIFEDDAGKMNLSVKDVEGEILAVSQFTLLGDSRKGRRPSFIKAAEPKTAEAYFQKLVERIESKHGIRVARGRFQEHMKVEINNDGPVTMLLDSNKKF